MRTGSLHLKNFGPHRDLVVELPVGITGIIGANGSGKSTIAQAFQFAILGESGNPGAKIDDLNWLAADAGEGGSVDWSFEKDGQPGTLKRAIQRATASLAWGEVKERSVSAVNTKILELLGVSEKTLKDIVFVMQGSIDRVLFDRPAERKKNFHALFGIDKAEDVRELLRKELTTLGADPNDERIEQLERRLKVEIDPQLQALVGRQQELSAVLAALDRAAFQTVISKYEEVQRLQQQIDVNSGAIAALLGNIQQYEQQRDQLQQQLMANATKLQAGKDGVDNLKTQLASIDSAKKVHDTIVSLQSRRQEAEARAQAPNPTPPDTSQDQIGAAMSELGSARAELAPKQAFVAAFKNVDAAYSAKCPTCGQSVPDAGDRVQRLQVEIEQQVAKIAAVENAVKQASEELQQYEHAKIRHASAVAAAQRAIADFDKQLADIGPDQYTADNEALAQRTRQALDEFAQLEQEKENINVQLAHVNGEIAGKSGQITSLRAQLAMLESQLSEAPDEQSYRTAMQTVLDIDAQTAELANVGGQITQLQQHRASTITELEQLKQQASNMAATKKYQEMCERARSLFHHDCLPQVTTQAYLSSLNAHLNKYLQTFQVPFACTITDDLSVTCLFPGVGVRTATRLSGGQKVMLGIAFRFAIYDMFAADLGFMVLDEPTNMLDEDRVANVVEVLESVRRHAHNTGMQLIVITHERELMRSFDHTIQL